MLPLNTHYPHVVVYGLVRNLRPFRGEGFSRNISLGICAVPNSIPADLRCGMPASARGIPLVTGLMARRGN
jgi:hypothetical protein